MDGTNDPDRRTPLDYGIAPPDFRLPDDTTIGAVRLQVADLQRSLDYYRDVLGMRTLAETTDTAALGANGSERVLVNLHGRPGTRPAPRRGTFGLFHFAILLPDRAALGRLVTHLNALRVPAGSADHLVSEAIYLTDPDGLGIEVYADRPRASWRREGRQLAMTTDPLDLGSVMAAADRPWDGLPLGTVMGHVHLHVGDLNQAADFYHAALGLDQIVWNYPGALFLSAGGYHHHLGTNTWAAGGHAADDQARLLEWELLVPRLADASAAANSLESRGHVVERSTDGWTSRDPWDTPIRMRATGG